MIEPPIPDDEAKRLALLKACKILYTPAEEAFDEVARLAAELCGAEIALITLVDSDYHPKRPSPWAPMRATASPKRTIWASFIAT
jgi:hypothetical protein